MKSIITFLSFVILSSLPLGAQGDLAILLGVNTNTQDYNPVSGINLSLQYKLGTYEKLRYGLGLQYARFIFDLGAVYQSSTTITALHGFAEYTPFKKLKKVEPYFKIEMGPAYCVAKGEIDFIIFESSEKISFLCAQVSPGIGSRFEIAKNIHLQLDLKSVINYGNKFDFAGFYNYSSFNLGVNIAL